MQVAVQNWFLLVTYLMSDWKQGCMYLSHFRYVQQIVSDKCILSSDANERVTSCSMETVVLPQASWPRATVFQCLN